MENAMEKLIPITMLIAIVAIVKIISDNKIKRLAIEKGLVSENLKYLYLDRFERWVPGSLKWGIVLVSLGLALLVVKIYPGDISDEFTIGSMFLFAGLGLVIYYFVASRIAKKAKKEGAEL